MAALTSAATARSSATTWTSKLGTRYDMDEIKRADATRQSELRARRPRGVSGRRRDAAAAASRFVRGVAGGRSRPFFGRSTSSGGTLARWRRLDLSPAQALRRRPENARCADCGAKGTVWAIVNHGVFVCLRCASLHRSLGTHISVPKGCTGTYLWGADELARMRPGNAAANAALGCDDARVPGVGPDCGDAELTRFLRDKYEKKRWAPAVAPRDAPDSTVAPPDVPDLISFDEPPAAAPAEGDFFAAFGL